MYSLRCITSVEHPVHEPPWDPTRYDGGLSDEAFQQELEAATLGDIDEAPTSLVNNLARIDEQYPDDLSAGTATIPQAPSFELFNEETGDWNIGDDSDPMQDASISNQGARTADIVPHIVARRDVAGHSVF
jgi:hypothetical protein